MSFKKPTGSKSSQQWKQRAMIAAGVCAASAGLYWYLYHYKKCVYDEDRKVEFTPIPSTGKTFEKAQPKFNEHFDDVAATIAETNTQKKFIEPYIDENLSFDIHPEAVSLIRNLLSAEECKLIRQAALKTGFDERNSDEDGTESTSCVVWSEDLTKAIYHRLGPLLADSTHFDAGKGITLKEFGDTLDTLDPTYFGKKECINPHIRVARNLKSLPTAVERTGWVSVFGEKDLFTVYAIIVYLNEEFGGGATSFADTVNTGNNAEEYNYVGIKGAVGDALVYRHEILNKGGAVLPKSGDIPAPVPEFILRMDAAYRLIPQKK